MTTDASKYLLLTAIEYLILEPAQSCPEFVYMQNNRAFLTYETIY